MTESTLTEDSPESADQAVADTSAPQATPEPTAAEPAPAEAEATAQPEAQAAVADAPTEPATAGDHGGAEDASTAKSEDGAPADVETPSESAATDEPTAQAAPAAADDSEPASETAESDEPEADASATDEATTETGGAPSPQTEGLWAAMQEKRPVKGKVIGWNKGGFHVVVEKITAFCPHSEMELGKPAPPQDHLDKTYDFAVLEIHDSGRRIVLSRTMMLRGERSAQRRQTVGKLEPGAVVVGRVASITDFGAFVELGGVQGLVHVSELKRSRVNHPSDVVELGQEVEVKVLKVDKGGKRISLSMKELQPDPWEGVGKRFVEGSVVRGTIEKVAPFGAFVVLEPGLSGLLPSSAINLPHGASLGRIYPPGKEISVEIRRVDARRRRISLALEGSQSEGSRADFERYVQGAQETSSSGFNALAAALEKIKGS